MAARLSSHREIRAFGDFESVFDELFDEFLVGRWRPTSLRAAGRALIVDRGAEYEVTLAAANADPRLIEVEAGDRRLVVRIPGAAGVHESVFDFPAAIDSDRVRALWRGGALQITLPKRPVRRISVE
ncbi:hypothetical protein IMX07_15510 [bacterium]|nr:hypothetical protein [bacterium]